jgi:hypothetical protein
MNDLDSRFEMIHFPMLHHGEIESYNDLKFEVLMISEKCFCNKIQKLNTINLTYPLSRITMW